MPSSEAMIDQPIQFGPYLLTECVGQGGMAVVYKAVRRGPGGFEKTVVIKAMLPSLSSQREFVAMFSAEARLMAQLTHPHIVQVHEFGIIDEVPFLVLEYLPGRNLAQLRQDLAPRGERLPLGASLAIVQNVCLGLGYIHDFVDAEGRKRQIIHRDVSPSNVMVCRDGAVKLLDFGVAKMLDEFECEHTKSFRGKYAYMAPEQVDHRPIDRRVDVFAAGVVLHELLTGKRLFAANSELETLRRVSAAQVVAPSVDNQEVPRALDLIVKRALARDPAERYGSGGELAEALGQLGSLTWTGKQLSTWVSELFAADWGITCEVCGKRVARGDTCQECGTVAPALGFPPGEPTQRAAARGGRTVVASPTRLARSSSRPRPSLALVRAPLGAAEPEPTCTALQPPLLFVVPPPASIPEPEPPRLVTPRSQRPLWLGCLLLALLVCAWASRSASPPALTPPKAAPAVASPTAPALSPPITASALASPTTASALASPTTAPALAPPIAPPTAVPPLPRSALAQPEPVLRPAPPAVAAPAPARQPAPPLAPALPWGQGSGSARSAEMASRPKSAAPSHRRRSRVRPTSRTTVLKGGLVNPFLGGR